MQLLAAHIAPQIGLSTGGQLPPIDGDLVNFAITRHRVGPFLHAASGQSQNLDDRVAALLSACFQKNLRENLAKRAVLQRLIKLFDDNGIAFSVLKGVGLADQIYDDPNLRLSKDIDILIPVDAAEPALRLLGMNGYVHKPHSIKKNPKVTLKRQLSDMTLFKDLTFVDPKFNMAIELHQRLFRFEPKGLTDAFNASVGFRKIPSIEDGHYCLYIILHGAVSLWFRLKWLADLSLLVRRMPVQLRQPMMEIARKHGCLKVVCASLWLAEDMFPGTLDDEWRIMLEDRNGSGEVEKLIALFRKALLTTSSDRPDLSARRSRFFDVSLALFGQRIGRVEVIARRIKAAIAVRM